MLLRRCDVQVHFHTVAQQHAPPGGPVQHVVHTPHRADGFDDRRRVGRLRHHDERRDQRLEPAEVARRPDRVECRAAAGNRREKAVDRVPGAPERQRAEFGNQGGDRLRQPLAGFATEHLRDASAVQRLLQVGERDDAEPAGERGGLRRVNRGQLEEATNQERHAGTRRPDDVTAAVERDLVQASVDVRADAWLAVKLAATGAGHQAPRTLVIERRDSRRGEAQIRRGDRCPPNLRQVGEDRQRCEKRGSLAHPLAAAAAAAAAGWGADLLSVGSLAVTHSPMPP